MRLSLSVRIAEGFLSKEEAILNLNEVADIAFAGSSGVTAEDFVTDKYKVKGKEVECSVVLENVSSELRMYLRNAIIDYGLDPAAVGAGAEIEDIIGGGFCSSVCSEATIPV